MRRLAFTLLLVPILAGCGEPPPDPRSYPVGTPTRTATRATVQATATRLPRPSVSAAPFPESTAVSCGSRVSANQVIVLIRQASMLPAGTPTPTATVGPLCSGQWQYTVLAVPDREPLQVVSRIQAERLTLVTAGTDVCTVQVRTEAPTGIVSAARCG